MKSRLKADEPVTRRLGEHPLLRLGELVRAVSPQGAEVVPAKGEPVVGQQSVGALLGQLVPLELEEEQERLDLGTELAATLHQRSAWPGSAVSSEKARTT